MRGREAILCGLLLLMAGSLASIRAHTPVETVLTLFVSATNDTGRWDMAQRDLAGERMFDFKVLPF